MVASLNVLRSCSCCNTALNGTLLCTPYFTSCALRRTECMPGGGLRLGIGCGCAGNCAPAGLLHAVASEDIVLCDGPTFGSANVDLCGAFDCGGGV